MNLTDSVFAIVTHKSEYDLVIQEEAWKALDALTHYFYFSFFDKVNEFMKAALD